MQKAKDIKTSIDFHLKTKSKPKTATKMNTDTKVLLFAKKSYSVEIIESYCII